MIPLRLKELRIKEEIKQLGLNRNNLVCKSCAKKLEEHSAYVYLSKDTGILHTSCEQCLHIALSSTSTAYYDSYAIYKKRKKSGWIDQMYKSYMINRKEKNGSINKKGS